LNTALTENGFQFILFFSEDFTPIHYVVKFISILFSTIFDQNQVSAVTISVRKQNLTFFERFLTAEMKLYHRYKKALQNDFAKLRNI